MGGVEERKGEKRVQIGAFKGGKKRETSSLHTRATSTSTFLSDPRAPNVAEHLTPSRSKKKAMGGRKGRLIPRLPWYDSSDVL